MKNLTIQFENKKKKIEINEKDEKKTLSELLTETFQEYRDELYIRYAVKKTIYNFSENRIKFLFSNQWIKEYVAPETPLHQIDMDHRFDHIECVKVINENEKEEKEEKDEKEKKESLWERIKRNLLCCLIS